MESKTPVEQLIDFEVSRLDASEKRQGWDLWAMYAAFGGIVWLALNEAKKGELNYSAGLAIWSMLVYFEMAKIPIEGLLRGDSSTAPGRFSLSNAHMGSSRLHILGVAAKVLCAIYIMEPMVHAFGPAARIAFYGTSGLYAVAFLGAFVMSFVRYPMARGDPSLKRRNIGIGLVLSIFSAAAAYVVIVSVAKSGSLASIAGWKAGLLLFALVEISELILSHNAREPFLAMLIGLKRDMALGLVTNETAKSQLELALKGMKAGDYMASEVNEYISINQEMTQCIKEIVEQEAQILALLESRKGVLTDADEEIIRTRIIALDASSKQCRPIIDRARKQVKKIGQKTSSLARIAPSCVDDINTLKERLENVLNGTYAITSKGEEYAPRIRELLVKSNKPNLVSVLDVKPILIEGVRQTKIVTAGKTR